LPRGRLELPSCLELTCCSWLESYLSSPSTLPPYWTCLVQSQGPYGGREVGGLPMNLKDLLIIVLKIFICDKWLPTSTVCSAPASLSALHNLLCLLCTSFTVFLHHLHCLLCTTCIVCFAPPPLSALHQLHCLLYTTSIVSSASPQWSPL
jgi:hypothetical protein